MNGGYLLIIGILGLTPFITPVFAQVEINVTDSGEPCFFNYTAGVDLWRNCGADEDYLEFVLLPWEWVTGGLFSMVIVSIIIVMTWIKYHTIIYPIAIGIVMIPTSYFLFPEVFLSWSIIMAFLGIGILIWYVFIRQTKEY